MKPILASAAFLLVAAAPALAQDAPGGPAKGDGAAPPPADPAAKAPAAPAKKERKVDAKATEAIEKYRKMLHHPTASGVKRVQARAEIQLQMLPEPLVVRPDWQDLGEKGASFKLDVEVPDSIKQAYGPEAVEMMQKQFGSVVDQMIEPLFFNDPGRAAQAYDLAAKDEAGGVAIVMTPFDDAAAKNERQKMIFGADGLLSRFVFTPKIDPEDPNAAMMAGVEIDVTVLHEKRGDRHVACGFTALHPMGEMKSKTTFWDGPGGLPLPKEVEISLPMMQEPIQFQIHDYVVDGKSVEATVKPKDAAPADGAEPAPKAPPADAPPGPEKK